MAKVKAKTWKPSGAYWKAVKRMQSYTGLKIDHSTRTMSCPGRLMYNEKVQKFAHRYNYSIQLSIV